MTSFERDPAPMQLEAANDYEAYRRDEIGVEELLQRDLSRAEAVAWAIVRARGPLPGLYAARRGAVTLLTSLLAATSKIVFIVIEVTTVAIVALLVVGAVRILGASLWQSGVFAVITSIGAAYAIRRIGRSKND